MIPVLILGDAEMSKVFIPLSHAERRALILLAEKELRDPRYQAVLIIRDELTRRGFLPQEQLTPTHPVQALEPVSAN